MNSDEPSPGLEPGNPMHDISRPETRWSRVNAEEAFPGVAKPLCWDFFGGGTNRSWRGMLTDFGLLGEDEHLPDNADLGYLNLFYGRSSINLDKTMAVMSRFPGDMAGDHARELFADHSTGAMSNTSRRAAPIDLEKFKRHKDRIRDIVIAEHDELHAWWREQTAPEVLADKEGSSARYFEALRRYESAQKNHSGNSTLCQQAFSAAGRLAAEIGEPGLTSKLTTGFGDTIDTRAMADLWRVSRGQMTMTEFLAIYGYQCSHGDDISEESWRENPRSLVALAETYAKMDESASPSASEHKRGAERQEVEARVLAALPAERHAAARALFADLQAATRVREMGKASYKMAIDAGRAASRTRGGELVDLEAIDRPNDVYFLTEAEAFGQVRDFRLVVAERKSICDRYSKLEIPISWNGNPIPIVPIAPGFGVPDDWEISGIGAGAGVVEGPVRLVLHHASAEPMEPSDILVVHTTDPSWGPFFVVAGAVVIDIGGQMSHGAIIARELGIPCVINTANGTQRLKDGDWVRVDGDAGRVTILRRPGAALIE